jgi:hypothetical protein
MSHHLHVVVSGSLGGAAKAGIGRDVRIAVDFNDVRRAVGGYAHVYPGVALAANGLPGPPGGGHDAVTENRGHAGRADHRGVVIGKRIHLPLGGEGNDLLKRVGKGTEIYLCQGQYLWGIAPQ